MGVHEARTNQVVRSIAVARGLRVFLFQSVTRSHLCDVTAAQEHTAAGVDAHGILPALGRRGAIKQKGRAQK